MTTREDLYQAVLAHPDEDTPRLAFADFLQEQGGKDDTFRADAIRTHCRLAREEFGTPGWRELRARWAELYPKALGRPAWVAHLKGRVKAWDFERGLIGHVTVFSKRFVAEGNRYFEQDPIRSVKFVVLSSPFGTVTPAELFDCPHLARAARLSLDGSDLRDKQLGLLGASAHLRTLRALSLGGANRFTRVALPKLLQALPGLGELLLTGNTNVGNAHAQELAGCPALARLAVLDLRGCAVGVPGVRAIVGSRHAANLTALRLGHDPTFDTAEDGTDAPAGYRLGVLGTRDDGLAVAGAVAAARLPNLRELDLGSWNLGPDGLRLLAEATGLPALRRLRLRDTGLAITGVRALARSGVGRRLAALDVLYNGHLTRYEKEVRALFPEALVQL